MLTLGVKNQSSNQTGKIDSIDPNSLSTFNKTNKFSTEAQDGLTMSRIKIKHNEIVRHNYMRLGHLSFLSSALIVKIIRIK